MTHSIRVFAIVLVLCGLSAAARAQVAQAELRGTVADESGAVLPGATITATHVDTGTERTTVSTSTGAYVMPALPIGNYTIKAELTGFGSITKEGVRLGVGESGTLNFTLKVAPLAENVTVTGESPLVDTKKSDLSGH